jgi:hypothetical protein
MIEQYYASHIKHMIDGEAVNVCRPRSNGRHTGREISAKRSKFGQDTEIGTNADVLANFEGLAIALGGPRAWWNW